jgi:GT2 family glycosyltransferase
VDETRARVGVVMVNWNRAPDTAAAYRSLLASTFRDWRLYVVDNASSDTSAEILRRDLVQQSTLILNDTNAGFSGGCNLGIDRALGDGCTHIFLLNNDATVLPSTLERLVEQSAALGDSAILGSAVKLAGTDQFQFFGSRTRPDFGHPVWFDDRDLDKLTRPLIETDFVLGAALFAPAKIWRELGVFDEKFYLNYEETDWCYRARNAGYPCYIMPTSVVLHKNGATVGPINGPLQNYFIYRNELLFGFYHGTAKQKANLAFRTTKVLLKSIAQDLIRFRKVRPATLAHAIALYDVARRRFGDCPKIIRRFARQYKAE